MSRTESQIRVESRPHDDLVRTITRRLPRFAARVVIKLHRWFVGRRLPPIVIDSNIRMAVDPQDNLGHHLFYFGTYEPNEGRLWERLLSEGVDLVVLNVGANVGYYSLLAAAHPNVTRVVSFEPNPMVIPVLKYNVAANPSSASKTTIVEMAAGDTDGTVAFHRNFAQHNFGLGSLHAQTDDAMTVDVPLVRLDHYLASIGVTKVDLAKIDVEGGELTVLRGLLGYSRPRLVIEIHPHLLPAFGSTVSDVLEALAQANYRVLRLAPDGNLTSPAALNDIAWVLAEPV